MEKDTSGTHYMAADGRGAMVAGGRQRSENELNYMKCGYEKMKNVQHTCTIEDARFDASSPVVNCASHTYQRLRQMPDYVKRVYTVGNKWGKHKLQGITQAQTTSISTALYYSYPTWSLKHRDPSSRTKDLQCHLEQNHHPAQGRI